MFLHHMIDISQNKTSVITRCTPVFDALITSPANYMYVLMVSFCDKALLCVHKTGLECCGIID